MRFGFSAINLILFLSFFGLWIYSFILFIQLARRGIEALDIFIKKEKQNDRKD